MTPPTAEVKAGQRPGGPVRQSGQCFSLALSDIDSVSCKAL